MEHASTIGVDGGVGSIQCIFVPIVESKKPVELPGRVRRVVKVTWNSLTKISGPFVFHHSRLHPRPLFFLFISPSSSINPSTPSSPLVILHYMSVSVIFPRVFWYVWWWPLSDARDWDIYRRWSRANDLLHGKWRFMQQDFLEGEKLFFFSPRGISHWDFRFQMIHKTAFCWWSDWVTLISNRAGVIDDLFWRVFRGVYWYI